MALIACPECGQKVSSTAEACPGCGHAVAKERRSRAVGIGCGGIMLIIFILFAIGSQTPSPKTTVAATPMAITVSPWPPIDPDEEITKVVFSAAWAKRLRGFKTLAEIQNAAGTKGKITSRGADSQQPYAAYHWISVPGADRPGGFVMATQSADGRIGVGVLTIDVGQIVLNTDGSFICDECNPPIDIRR